MKLSNINRDYMVIIDVKSGSVNKPTMVFYNTDKNTSNIYAQLVVKETIVAATPIENATDYSVELKVVKPGSIVKFMDGTLVNEAEAIYEFDLPEDFTNLSGNYDIEFWVKAKVNDRDEMITSSKAKYTVKPSILTDLDEAIEDHDDYPLFLKLMEEVKVINETAHELDTTIRTLQSDMIEANNEMKTNEATRQANETTRVANEEARVEAERTRVNQEATREANEQRRITNEDERKVAENQRKANEFERRTNEAERKSAEASRVSAENARANAEEVRQTNEANRETAEEIRKANEEARITAETARVTEHEQMRTELNEVKAENAILMENDKKVSDRMTQVEISDKRQYVIMEGLMNSAGDGYLKIEDTGNDTTLYNSVEGFVDVKNITGNTMVNSIKNPDDELTLNGDINTSGQSVTLTTAVDNGQVDVLAEGNTMVNVCDQQEAVAITKSYTVENGNHVALQGEYDGKARPVVQGNTLVNLLNHNSDKWSVNTNSDGYKVNAYKRYSSNIGIQPNKTYTVVLSEMASSCNGYALFQYSNNENTVIRINARLINNKYFTINLTDITEPLTNGIIIYQKYNAVDGNINPSQKSNFYILEGDYTNKPIPDYFTGMQSSFEDKVVTQEMVDSGKELAENLGKYRVDYKVTGKNKFNGNIYQGSISSLGVINSDSSVDCHTDLIKVIPGNTYIISNNLDLRYDRFAYYDKNKMFMYRTNSYYGSNLRIFTVPSDVHYLRITLYDARNSLSPSDFTWYQIEEGSTATPYEPYKEQVKTYYLNSPLLEGDTIEDNGNDVVHVHRYGKIVFDASNDEKWQFVKQENSGKYVYQTDTLSHTNEFKPILLCDKFSYVNWNDSPWNMKINCISSINAIINIYTDIDTLDKFKSWLQTNPVSVVCQKQTPTREVISQNDSILQDSYVNGHLDADTAVPIDKVEFKSTPNIFMRYLYPNTNYVIKFEADNDGYINEIYLNGIQIRNQEIKKGINIFTGTTGTNNWVTLDMVGIGFNASKIVVTEATDKDFGYFAGMKSVGELEENKIEILSINKNLVDWSTRKPYGIKDSDIVQNDDNGFIFKTTAWNVGINLYVDIKYFHKNSYYKLSTSLPDGADKICLLSDVLYLDDNKNSLGKVNNNKGMIYTDNIPANAKYIRLFFKNYTNNETKTNGLSSVQIEKVSDSSGTNTDYIPHAENKKQILLNEPLRAVGDTKDRFVQIDGKWYVERNVGSYTITGNESWSPRDMTDYVYYYLSNNTVNNLGLNIKASNKIISDKISYNSQLSNGEGIKSGNAERIQIRKDGFSDISSFKAWLSQTNLVVTYILETPTYEPVEIAPVLNTYTDVTYITNNSTIPMNMPIVNSGYEVIAKPSTKYTVVGCDNGRIGDSTIVNGTITTPATITDPFLRPYGTGKTSKVMLLEGEPADIPAYFKGIKSVFEDKVTDDGKYACEVRVYNDLGEETKQTLYLDEPLYNTNNITIYNDKLGYWKNWDKVVLDGSDDEEWWDTSSFSISNNTIEFRGGYGLNIIKNSTVLSDLFASTPDIWTKDIENISPIENNCIDIRIRKSKLSTQDLTGFKQYLSENPVTVVYQLAEPEFVTLVKDTPNWIIGSWDNCSIHFDSIIPLSSTRYRYTGNVPSVISLNEEVSTVSDISDEQDSLLVDMATELAVMKLTM